MTDPAERSGSLVFVAPVFRVADLARSLAYYRDRLGFEVEFIYDGFYAGLRRDGCHIHLKCSGSTGRNGTALEVGEHVDATLHVRNAAALASGFAAAGARISVPLRTMPYGREFYVEDPDGYVLGFVEPAG
ncbi:MAG: VOC family protein [Chloroflexota bacterium]|nr:VOC family protein [Chloroflexota bacterium]